MNPDRAAPLAKRGFIGFFSNNQLEVDIPNRPAGYA